MVTRLTRAALSAAALCGLIHGAAAQSAAVPPLRHQTVPTVLPYQMDRNGILILIRSTLLALDQANQTGNYTVLQDIGTPQFQQTNNAVRLGEIFQPIRAQSLDLSGVSVLEPQLTLMPQIEPNGDLHMTGFFPSVPLQIKFDVLYAAVNQHWRLDSLSVSLTSAMPAPAPGISSVPASDPVGTKKGKSSVAQATR